MLALEVCGRGHAAILGWLPAVLVLGLLNNRLRAHCLGPADLGEFFKVFIVCQGWLPVKHSS